MEFTTKFPNAKILVIDDNPASVAFLESILDEAGYEDVTSLTDSREVQALYVERHFDVVLLDIRMPHPDGAGVMAELKQAAGGDYLPIIVIADQTDRETRYKALKSGAKDFLNKPFDHYEVLQRIDNMLQVRIAYGERRQRAVDLEEEVRKRAGELIEREEHLRGITETAAEIIVTAGDDGKIETFNRTAEELFLYSADEAREIALADLVAGKDRQLEPGDLEIQGRRKDGTTFPMEVSIREMEANGLKWRVLIGRDVTQRRIDDARMTWLANHDPLTELPNRTWFLRLLGNAIGEDDGGAPGLVLFITLKGHQRVSDICGHDVGEKLLRAVGERIRDEVMSKGIVGAWGGGEFVAVVSTDGAEEPEVFIRTLRDAIENPFLVDGMELNVWCHIGVSVFPGDGRDPQRLIKNASTAMYFGKKTGNAEATFYSPTVDETTAHRHTMERELRHALEREQLCLYYQPKVDLLSGEVVGMEALIRWQHPDLGLVSPDQFIHLAEETGLIVPIGEWVLRTACSQTKAWNEGRDRPLEVAVNLSGRQFDAGNLVDTVESALQAAGLDIGNLELEVTESAAMRDVDLGQATLHALRELGIGIAIDDFGTGYSSLSQMRRLPLTTLKIDRSFVTGVTENEDDAVIVRMIIDMARNLCLKVVAEGIETKAHAAFLEALRCDLGQGYLYARPLPAEDFLRSVAEKGKLKKA